MILGCNLFAHWSNGLKDYRADGCKNKVLTIRFVMLSRFQEKKAMDEHRKNQTNVGNGIFPGANQRYLVDMIENGDCCDHNGLNGLIAGPG